MTCLAHGREIKLRCCEKSREAQAKSKAHHAAAKQQKMDHVKHTMGISDFESRPQGVSHRPV
eukprot:scaffold1841_cov35-Tisochrysis_lutea.AAC.1